MYHKLVGPQDLQICPSVCLRMDAGYYPAPILFSNNVSKSIPIIVVWIYIFWVLPESNKSYSVTRKNKPAT